MEKTLDKLYAIDLLGVLVNARDGGDFQGELLQLYSPEAVPFYSVLDLIKKMESFYDEWDYPQTACRDRSFRRRQKYVYPDRKGKKALIDAARTLEKYPMIEKRGKLATFFVHTKLRQRSSWQGDVYHGETGEVFSFQSVLSLLRIMDKEWNRR